MSAIVKPTRCVICHAVPIEQDMILNHPFDEFDVPVFGHVAEQSWFLCKSCLRLLDRQSYFHAATLYLRARAQPFQPGLLLLVTAELLAGFDHMRRGKLN